MQSLHFSVDTRQLYKSGSSILRSALSKHVNRIQFHEEDDYWLLITLEGFSKASIIRDLTLPTLTRPNFFPPSTIANLTDLSVNIHHDARSQCFVDSILAITHLKQLIKLNLTAHALYPSESNEFPNAILPLDQLSKLEELTFGFSPLMLHAYCCTIFLLLSKMPSLKAVCLYSYFATYLTLERLLGGDCPVLPHILQFRLIPSLDSETVTVTVPPPLLSEQVIVEFARIIPNLQVLEVSTDYRIPSKFWQIHLEYFSAFKNITHLYIDNMRVANDLNGYRKLTRALSHCPITALTLRCVDCESHLSQLLAPFPQLQRLNLSGYYQRTSFVELSRAECASTLTHLIFRASDVVSEFDPSGLEKLIKLVELTILNIDSVRASNSEFRQFCHSFNSHSSTFPCPSLQSLRILKKEEKRDDKETQL